MEACAQIEEAGRRRSFLILRLGFHLLPFWGSPAIFCLIYREAYAFLNKEYSKMD